MEPRISIHHIGGRGGGGFFPVQSHFEKDLVLTFYEADPDCLDQIKERNSYLKSELHVLPYCLGPSQGKATLHINYDPYTSSLLPPNPAYRQFRTIVNYGMGRELDYVMGDATRPMEERILSTVSLDEVCTGARPGSMPPDFLSVDTEGSEFDILNGAARILQHNTLAVGLEVEFHPLFAGQKLFGDICRLLAGHGFLFVGFGGEVPLWTPYRAPVSLRGKGFHLSDDALFIRSVESVATAPVDDPQRCLMLHKLAFLGVVFHQVEIAAESLRVAEGSKSLPSVRQEIGPLEYGRFLADFGAALRTQKAVFPNTFAGQFSFDDSRSRFATAGQRGVKWLELLRDWCVRKPSRWRLIKRVLRPAVSSSKRLKLLCSLLAKAKPFWRHPALQWRTPVERVLHRYGLDEQAQTVRHNRRRYAPFCDDPGAAP